MMMSVTLMPQFHGIVVLLTVVVVVVVDDDGDRESP